MQDKADMSCWDMLDKMPVLRHASQAGQFFSFYQASNFTHCFVIAASNIINRKQDVDSRSTQGI
jgi:hypothetical protein